MYSPKLWINLPELGILPLSSSQGLNTIICPDKKLEEEWTRPRADGTTVTEQRCSNNAHNPENTKSHKNQERQGTAAPGEPLEKATPANTFLCLEKLASDLHVCKAKHSDDFFQQLQEAATQLSMALKHPNRVPTGWVNSNPYRAQ